jgi:hypothetical protein
MIKHTLASLLLLSCGWACAAQLTDIETRWLSAGSAVLTYARNDLKLPIDIIVQPQARPNDVPLALGFQDGRCKLVLSMRGNPNAEDILAAVPAAQRPLMIEAMVAHEIGHCWRYVQGVWHALPAGFEENAGHAALSQEKLQALQETRREEGFADLVALAWTQHRHPAEYATVAAWMRQVRGPATSIAGVGSHTTLAWLQLAPTGAAFPGGLSLFEQAGNLWRQGLRAD